MFEAYPEDNREYKDNREFIRRSINAHKVEDRFCLDVTSCPVGSLLAQRIIFHLSVEDATSLKEQLESFISSM